MSNIGLKKINFPTRVLLFVYLVIWLRVNGGAPLCALQGLLHLLHLDCQMGLKVPA